MADTTNAVKLNDHPLSISIDPTITEHIDRVPSGPLPPTEKIWSCKIGGITPNDLPHGSDFPMRQVIQAGFLALTGVWPQFTFSGWSAELTEAERNVVEAKSDV